MKRKPAVGGFFVAPETKGRAMKNLSDLLSNGLRFMTGDAATISILVAVMAVSFFAFVLGAEAEMVLSLLALGILTAVVEARLHAK